MDIGSEMIEELVRRGWFGGGVGNKEQYGGSVSSGEWLDGSMSSREQLGGSVSNKKWFSNLF